MKLLLTGILLLTSITANAGTKTQTWICYSFFDKSNMIATVKLTSKNGGSVEIAGTTHKADYMTEGLSGRWNFGRTNEGSYNYSLVMTVTGITNLYDFTEAEEGAKVESSAMLACKKQ